MTIKHLVLSGGGLVGLATLGCIHKLLELEKIDINEIETIHSTSVGSVISLLLCFHKLGIENIMIKDYFIERPFEEVYKMSVQKIIDLYYNNGLFDQTTIFELFKPFFQILELDMMITMKEIYELTKIEIYMFSVNMNTFKSTEVSYKNSELSILHAIYMSCSVPIIFKPLKFEKNYYIDGSLLCNYPMKQCIEMNYNNEEILGIYFEKTENDTNIKDNNNILIFVLILLYNLILIINKTLNTYSTENINEIPLSLNVSFQNFKDIFYHQEKRISLYKVGEEHAHTAVFKKSIK
jgi:predicted acylesterase/phospholipase RssA